MELVVSTESAVDHRFGRHPDRLCFRADRSQSSMREVVWRLYSTGPVMFVINFVTDYTYPGWLILFGPLTAAFLALIETDLS